MSMHTKRNICALIKQAKLVDKFAYPGSSVSSTETDIDTWLAKALTVIDRLSVVWNSDLTDKRKRSFFQAASILLYGCTTLTLTKRMEKKLDGNYTRMLRVILKKSWRQHPTKQQLYSHLRPIRKTIKIRRTRHVGHCWRSSDEIINDVFLWTPSHGGEKVGRPARAYIQQLCANTGCSPLRPAGSNEWWGGVARGGQRYPCWECDMMMMMGVFKVMTTMVLMDFNGMSTNLHLLFLVKILFAHGSLEYAYFLKYLYDTKIEP